MISHPYGARAPPHVERTLLCFLNKIVDRRYVSVASLEDFLLYPLGEAGNPPIDINGFVAGKVAARLGPVIN